MKGLFMSVVFVLGMAPAAFGGEGPQNAVQQGASGEDSLILKLEKEHEMAKAAEISFTKDKAARGELKYKGYKHRGMEGYEKVAVREKILDGDWEAKCRGKAECASAIEAPAAKPGQDVKAGIKKLAQKIAFIKAAKKALKAKKEEAERNQDTAAGRKIEAADKVLKADHEKYAAEAKRKNELLKVKIFDPDDKPDQP